MNPASWIFFIISRQMTPLFFSRRHPVENRPAQQPEITVDVADLQSEQQLHGVVVDAADHDPVQTDRIG